MKPISPITEKIFYSLFLVSWLMLIFGGIKTLAISKSSSYQLAEPQLGGFGQDYPTSSSNSISSLQTGGALGIGSASTSTDQIRAGHQTTNDPALSFSILSVNNFGSFSPESTATATTTFNVTDYTSYGYIVQIFGTPPTNSNGYVIGALTSPSSAQIGVNQFGLNLVANSSPIAFGAGPIYGLLGSGSISPNYAVANKFMFLNGDTVATSLQSSGQTTYTISYIVNVAPLIPGGQYQSLQNIVCTATY